MKRNISSMVEELRRVNLKEKALRKEMVNPSEEELKRYWESRNRNAMVLLLVERLGKLTNQTYIFYN